VRTEEQTLTVASSPPDDFSFTPFRKKLVPGVDVLCRFPKNELFPSSFSFYPESKYVPSPIIPRTKFFFLTAGKTRKPVLSLLGKAWKKEVSQNDRKLSFGAKYCFRFFRYAKIGRIFSEADLLQI
jgi:hypothetical protein